MVGPDDGAYAGTTASTKDRAYSEDHDMNDDYRYLLNEAIVDAQQGGFCHTSTSHRANPGQVGMTYWSSEDKHRLYQALARYGPYDLDHLQNRLPNQSALETQQYLQLLRRASDQHYLDGAAKSIVKYRDIPAAVEIDESCCKILEAEADKVQMFQLSTEEDIEKKRFGKYWLLDGTVVDELDGLRTGTRDTGLPDGGHDKFDENDSAGLDRLRPILDLLRLSTWLDISEGIFNDTPLEAVNETDSRSHDMHAAGWQPLDTSRLSQYKSSIFATAFEDFHRVAVSLTRRIVCTALFQAESRLRATDVRSDNARRFDVKIGDVYAAIDILGVPRDPKVFWATAPRRHRLDVYDYKPNDRQDSYLYARSISRIRDLGTRLSYDEVESRLGLKRPSIISAEYEGDQVDPEVEQEGPDRSEVQDKRTDFETAIQVSGHAPASANHEELSEDRPYLLDETERDSYDQEQEKLAEAFDGRQSRAANKNFFFNLREGSPSHETSESDDFERSEQCLFMPRPTRNDLLNWREKTTYKPEWERFGHCLTFPEPRVEINEHKRSWSQTRRNNFDRGKRRRTNEAGDYTDDRSPSRSQPEDRAMQDDDARSSESGSPRGRGGRTQATSRSRSRSKSYSRGVRSEVSSSPSEDGDSFSSSPSIASRRGRRSTRSSPISYALPPNLEPGAMPIDDESSADDYVPDR